MDLTTAVRRLFAPARRPGRVGAEVELIPLAAGPRPDRIAPHVLASAFGPTFTRSARLSFEPGGQLELSPAPAPLEAFLPRLTALVGRAAELAGQHGVQLAAVGTDPYHSTADVPLHLTSPRYRAMQALFDRVGPDGRRMMRLTASLQIAVDLQPGQAGWEQWAVANLAGPALAATYANSPWLDGRPAGLPGARTRIWQRVDLRRTAYDGRSFDLADPVGAYAAFAAAAARLPIPEADDPHYHLTTLFPPVRPRAGYLEIRYLDAQPLDRVAEVIRVVNGLLTEPVARRTALRLLRTRSADLGAAWHDAARGIAPEADELLSLVGARRPEASELQAGVA